MNSKKGIHPHQKKEDLWLAMQPPCPKKQEPHQKGEPNNQPTRRETVHAKKKKSPPKDKAEPSRRPTRKEKSSNTAVEQPSRDLASVYYKHIKLSCKNELHK
jgi:hypothetical protein